jgi:hypothetical protein
MGASKSGKSGKMMLPILGIFDLFCAKIEKLKSKILNH